MLTPGAWAAFWPVLGHIGCPASGFPHIGDRRHGYVMRPGWFGRSRKGQPGHAEQKRGARLAALGKAVVYGVLAFTAVKYAIGAGVPKSSNQ